MGGYIVLCDHNSKWAEKFTDEAIKRNIQTVVVESIAEIEDKLTADGSSIMLVCSLIELREYLKNNTVDEKIFFEKVSVFVIRTATMIMKRFIISGRDVWIFNGEREIFLL